jgi:hypothetical protein
VGQAGIGQNVAEHIVAVFVVVQHENSDFHISPSRLGGGSIGLCR